MWGGIDVNDRTVTLLEQYDIDVIRTKKGRGALLCDTDKGTLILKEYSGNPEKIIVQEMLLSNLAAAGLLVEKIFPSKEESLFVEDNEGKKYLLKSYFENRECNIRDMEECKEAVRTLARLHRHMRLTRDEVESYGISPFSIEKDYEKHNKELRKVWRYLRKKSQKTMFEVQLLQEYNYFLDQAQEIFSQWQAFALPEDLEYIKDRGLFCHGEYQYHNIIKSGYDFAVINFERCIMDNPVRDLCYFMRKLLEKGDWSIHTGDALLEAYNSVNPLPARFFVELYYRLAYPEKFWKIVNFYFNSGKAWIPERNREKLEILCAQEKEKQEFLDVVFRTVGR